MAYVGDDGKAERGGCVFCDLPARNDDESTYILHRGALAFVIMNLYPYNNGHLMLVPYQHVPALTDLPPETLAELMALAQRSEAVLQEAMHPQGYNLGINQGRAAGAGIADHIHMHVVPRWIGDTNFMPVLGDVRVLPQHLDETYALLRPGFEDRGAR
jgi:ATP adenylyltransferase